MANENKDYKPLPPDAGKEFENFDDILSNVNEANNVNNILKNVASELRNIANQLIENKESTEKLFNNIVNELKLSNSKLSALLDFQKPVFDVLKNLKQPLSTYQQSESNLQSSDIPASLRDIANKLEDLNKQTVSKSSPIENINVDISDSLKQRLSVIANREQQVSRDIEQIVNRESEIRREIFGQMLGYTQFGNLYAGAEEQAENILDRLDVGRVYGENFKNFEQTLDRVQKITESILSPFSYPVMLKRLVPGYETSETIRELEFGRMMSSPIGAITLSAMMGLILPMQFAMFAPITEPMNTYNRYRELTTQIAESFAPISDIVNVMYDILKQSPLERYENMYLAQMILTSSLQSVRAANETINNALRLARETPLEFSDILQAFRSLAVYPSVKPYISSYEFQKQLANVVSGLALINPEQGVSGALFSIVEALSGSLRSLQMRFNISPEIIASLAGMSKEEMSSSPVKLIEGLNKFIERSIGKDVLENYSYTFTKQIGNLEDTFNMFVKQTFEQTGLYNSITTLAISLNSIASALVSSPEAKTGINYLLEPIQRSIYSSIASIIGISPDIVQTMSFQQIETMLTTALSNMSAKDIADVLDNIVQNISEGFVEFKQRLEPITNEVNKIISSSISALSQSVMQGVMTGITGFAQYMITHPGTLAQLMLSTALVAAPIMLAHKGISKVFELGELMLYNRLNAEVSKGSPIRYPTMVSPISQSEKLANISTPMIIPPQISLDKQTSIFTSEPVSKSLLEKGKGLIGLFNERNIFERFMYGLTAGEIYNLTVGSITGLQIPDLAILTASIASPYINKSSISNIANILKTSKVFRLGGTIVAGLGTAYSAYEYYKWIKEEQKRREEAEKTIESIKNIPFINEQQIGILTQAAEQSVSQSLVYKVLGHISNLLKIGGSSLATVGMFTAQPELSLIGVIASGIGYGIGLLNDKFLANTNEGERNVGNYVLTMTKHLTNQIIKYQTELNSGNIPVELQPIIKQQIEQTKQELQTLLQAYKVYSQGDIANVANPAVGAMANLLQFMQTKNVEQFIQNYQRLFENTKDSQSLQELVKISVEQLNSLQKNQEYAKKLTELFSSNKEFTQMFATKLVDVYYKTDDRSLKNEIDKLVNSNKVLQTTFSSIVKQDLAKYSSVEQIQKLFETGNTADILKVGRELLTESKYDANAKQLLNVYKQELQQYIATQYPELANIANSPIELANVENIEGLDNTQRDLLNMLAEAENINSATIDMQAGQEIQKAKQFIPFLKLLPATEKLTIGKQLANQLLDKATEFLQVGKTEYALAYLKLASNILPTPILRHTINAYHPELVNLIESKAMDMLMPNLPESIVNQVVNDNEQRVSSLGNTVNEASKSANIHVSFDDAHVNIKVSPDMNDFSETIKLVARVLQASDEVAT